MLVVLWFTRRHIDGVLDGMLIGALVGLGFAMTENITYFGVAYSDGGAAAVGTLFIIRSLINGMGHAVWTSFTGAAVGWSRARHGRGVLRLIVPVIGWGAAVLGHSIWNLGASLTISVLTIGLERVFLLPEWQALILAGIVGGLPFSIPPLLVALLIALLGRDQESRVVRRYLPVEVRLGHPHARGVPDCQRSPDPQERARGGPARWRDTAPAPATAVQPDRDPACLFPLPRHRGRATIPARNPPGRAIALESECAAVVHAQPGRRWVT